MTFSHRIVLVLAIGGRDYIYIYNPQEGNIISGIYCQLGDFILPTTFYKNLNNPLIFSG